MSELDRESRLYDWIRASDLREWAREFDGQAQEAAEAGFPDVAEEAHAEARECRQLAAEAWRRVIAPEAVAS